MKRKLLLTIIAAICIAQPLMAKQNRVAVLPLQPDNCSVKVAHEATVLLRKYLNANNKVLVDTNKIKTVMVDFNLSSVANEFDAKRIIKYLPADDVVHGTIKKEDDSRYVITLHILEKRSWKVQVNKYMAENKQSLKYYTVASRKGVVYYKLKEAVAQKLTNAYILSQKKKSEPIDPVWYSGFADTAFISPFGRFGSLTNYGYGINIGLTAHAIPLTDSGINGSLRSGFYYFSGNSSSINYVMMVPLTMAVSRAFPVWNSIALEPVVSFGFLFSFMSHDDEHYPGEAYNYATSVYTDLLLSLTVEVHYTLTNSIDMLCAPSYSLFFEHDSVGQIFGMSIGARYRF